MTIGGKFPNRGEPNLLPRSGAPGLALCFHHITWVRRMVSQLPESTHTVLGALVCILGEDGEENEKVKFFYRFVGGFPADAGLYGFG
jgi:hypothetical protein